MKDFKTQKKMRFSVCSSGVPFGSLKPSSLCGTLSARSKLDAIDALRFHGTLFVLSSRLSTFVPGAQNSSTLKKTQLRGVLTFCHSFLFQH
ncbi:UNVERIFIED_CONTAM: hypothetical protein HHA_206695 [Hammondia hammondi]|eukprot:XP_008885995.1 hypothetical protein HHA_206695 [Hammondia hammondi]